MLNVATQIFEYHADFGHVRFGRRFAEVGFERGGNLALVGDDGFFERFKIGQASAHVQRFAVVKVFALRFDNAFYHNFTL